MMGVDSLKRVDRVVDWVEGNGEAEMPSKVDNAVARRNGVNSMVGKCVISCLQDKEITEDVVGEKGSVDSKDFNVCMEQAKWQKKRMDPVAWHDLTVSAAVC